MPNRILRDWTDSENVEKLSWQAEVMFVRLIQKADDFGRYLAHPKLLKASLFPLRDGVRETDIARLLAECEKAGVVVLYECGQKSYLEIAKWKQTIRAKESKYPAPPTSSTCVPDAEHMRSTCVADAEHMRSDAETKTEAETLSPQSPRAGGVGGVSPEFGQPPPEEKTLGGVAHWMDPATNLCRVIGSASGMQFTAQDVARWSRAFHHLHSKNQVAVEDLTEFPQWYEERREEQWQGLPVLSKPQDLVSKWPAIVAALQRWKGGA